MEVDETATIPVKKEWECVICEDEKERFAIISCMGYVCKGCSEDITVKYGRGKCVIHHSESHFRLFVPDPSPPTNEEVTDAKVRAQENLRLQQEQLTSLEAYQKEHLKIYETSRIKIQVAIDQLEVFRLDGIERLQALHKNQKEEVTSARFLLNQLKRIEEDVDMRRPFLENHHNQLHYPPRRIGERFVRFEVPYQSYPPPVMTFATLPIRKNLYLTHLRGSLYLPRISSTLSKDFMFEANGVRRGLEGPYFDTKAAKYPIYYRNCLTDFKLIVRVREPLVTLKEVSSQISRGPTAKRPLDAKGFLASDDANATITEDGVIAVRSAGDQLLTSLTINILSFRQFVTVSTEILAYLTVDGEMMCHVKNTRSGEWPLAVQFYLPHLNRFFRVHYCGSYFVLTLRPETKDGLYQLAVVNVAGKIVSISDIPFPFQITEVNRITKKFRVTSKDHKLTLELSVAPAPLDEKEVIIRTEEIVEDTGPEETPVEPPVFRVLDEETLRANARNDSDEEHWEDENLFD